MITSLRKQVNYQSRKGGGSTLTVGLRTPVKNAFARSSTKADERRERETRTGLGFPPARNQLWDKNGPPEYAYSLLSKKNNNIAVILFGVHPLLLLRSWLCSWNPTSNAITDSDSLFPTQRETSGPENKMLGPRTTGHGEQKQKNPHAGAEGAANAVVGLCSVLYQTEDAVSEHTA